MTLWATANLSMRARARPGLTGGPQAHAVNCSVLPPGAPRALPTPGPPTDPTPARVRERASQRGGRAAHPTHSPVYDRAVHEHHRDVRRVVLAGRALDPGNQRPVGGVQRVR